ncbi:hypothetical protein ACVBEG_26825 [Pseudomonas sp. GG8]
MKISATELEVGHPELQTLKADDGASCRRPLKAVCSPPESSSTCFYSAVVWRRSRTAMTPASEDIALNNKNNTFRCTRRVITSQMAWFDHKLTDKKPPPSL